MSKLEAFRKLIREEVRTVIMEEVVPLLKEVKHKPVKQINNSFANSLKEGTIKNMPTINKSTGDPLMDLLNETKMSMTNEDYRTIVNADSSMAEGFAHLSMSTNTSANVVQTVDQMLAQSHPATDVSQVRIDAVPDFSALMNTMKKQGQI